jgi:hypothetical protein
MVPVQLSVDVGTELFLEANYIQVSILGRNVKGRRSILKNRLVDVGAELSNQESYHLQMALRGRDVRGCECDSLIKNRLINVGTEIDYEASNNIQSVFLDGDAQGRDSIMPCLVDVGTTLFH